MNEQNIKQLALDIAHILDNKKAHDIKVLRVTEKTVIADYFVIAHGTSRTQVNALADEVEYVLGEQFGLHPTGIEGRGQGSWVLLDYDSVLVHVFDPKSRDFYNLEKLWSQAEEIEFKPQSAEEEK